MSQPLEGQVAVVTGASSGLGRHFAQVLAGAGASVALMARRADRLEADAEALRKAGGQAAAIALDVADVAAIGPAFDAAEAALGPISILVNNAGVGGAGLALEITPETWDQTFDVNVRGVFFAAREAARRMLASGVAGEGRGRIVNIASIAADEALPGLAAYSASKASVAMITRSLAREWARRGIAVNAIAPGYIETELNAEWLSTEGGRAQIAGFPRRRIIPAASLDATLLMLTGPQAAYITGSIVTIDDGQSL